VPKDAGVVDEDVDRSEYLNTLREESLDVALFRDIGVDGDRLATGSGDRRDHTVGTLAAGTIVDHDGRTCGGEMPGDGRANPLGRPCDDCNFSCECL
jgi:hypothetical protein